MNNNFVATESLTHDLVIFDARLTELKRFKGSPMHPSWEPQEPELSKYRRSVASADCSKILWIKGMHELAIFDTQTMTQDVIYNFWKDNHTDCFAFVATACSNFKKFAGIGYSNSSQTLHVMDRGQSLQVVTRQMSGLLRTSNRSIDLAAEAKCLEVSEDNSLVFIGGGGDNPSGLPTVSAVQFDKGMALVTEQILEVDGLNIVFSMIRHQSGNILFAGGYGHVVILFFNGRAFDVLGVLGKDASSDDPVLDLRLLGSKLFILCQPSRKMQVVTLPDKGAVGGGQANFRSVPPNNEAKQVAEALANFKQKRVALRGIGRVSRFD